METKTEVVGRNEPCPCGSRKKYKRCCGVSAPPLVSPPNPKEDTSSFSPPPSLSRMDEVSPGMFGGMPKGLSLKLMMKLSKILKKLPPEQMQKLQSLMSEAQAGKDNRREMEAFSKTLPAEFHELLQSFQKGQKDQKEEPKLTAQPPGVEAPQGESKFSKIWKSITGTGKKQQP